MRRRILAGATVLAALACADRTTAPAPDSAMTPAMLTKVAGDGQTATVNSAVPIRPAVLIEDANHQPMSGVAVVFAVVDGAGSVAVPNATTDTLGIATVGGWALGEHAGGNSLRATVANVVAVVFTATGTAGPPVALTAHSVSTRPAPVGGPPPVLPSVLVADRYGNPVQDAEVSFAVTSGGGSATGTSVITDSLGLATVGGWTLGTVVGANTLAAAAPGLTPVVFTVIAVAGPPASVVKMAGDDQVARVLSAVDTAPTIIVRDAFGNPASHVSVEFRVTEGGGRVGPYGGGDISYTQTDSTGTATAETWTLGPAAGANTLRAWVGPLPPLVFNAVAEDPHCAGAASLAVGSTVAGSLTSGDCRLPAIYYTDFSEYTDRYAVTTAGASSIRFEMSAAGYAPHISIRDAGGALAATTPYYCGGYCYGTAALRLLLPAGDYVVGVAGFDYDWGDSAIGGMLGSYTLSSALVDEDANGCERIFVVPGVTTTQRVDTTDCAATFRDEDFFFDQFRMEVVAGETYTISMASSDFDTFLDLLFLPQGDVNEWGASLQAKDAVASNDDAGGTTNSQVSYTPLRSGLVVIQAGTYKGNTTGAYSLSIQPAQATASRVIAKPGMATGLAALHGTRLAGAPLSSATAATRRQADGPAWTARPPKSPRPPSRRR